MIESELLPHSYRHLSPLASLVRARVKGVEKGERPLGGSQPPTSRKGGVFCRPLIADRSCDHEEPWRERERERERERPHLARKKASRAAFGVVHATVPGVPVGDREVGTELVIELAGIDSKLAPAQDHSRGHQMDLHLDTQLRDFEAQP